MNNTGYFKILEINLKHLPLSPVRYIARKYVREKTVTPIYFRQGILHLVYVGNGQIKLLNSMKLYSKRRYE
jgi:hypothetical protein